MTTSLPKFLQIAVLAALTLAAAACSSDQTPRADSPSDAASAPSNTSNGAPVSNRGRGN